jgi:hypothetical protein
VTPLQFSKISFKLIAISNPKVRGLPNRYQTKCWELGIAYGLRKNISKVPHTLGFPNKYFENYHYIPRYTVYYIPK